MQGNYHSLRLAAALCLLLSRAALAAVPESGCFDLASSEDVKPLQLTTARQSGSSGDLADGGSWASERAVVRRPLGEIVAELKSHERTKSGRVAEMRISDIADPRYFLRQSVHFEVHPFPFVNIEWNEDWAFELTAGTAANPERVIVAYQKADGTSHISHLCGSYVLARKGDASTEISLYEEARATRRSRQDTENGIKATLENLGRKN